MKIVITSLLILRLLELFVPTPPDTRLHELISVTEVSADQIESGELTIKESFNQRKQDQLQKTILDAGFRQTDLTAGAEFEMYQRQLTFGVFEEISLIETQDSRELTVNYHLSGDVVQVIDQTKNDQLIKSFLDTIYTNDKRAYACISLSNHDMMVKGYFLKKLQYNLQYEEIDRIEEPDLTVISAYSAEMGRAIPMEDKQMNLQIAARKGPNNKIKLLIGTPILTTEY